MNVPTLWLDSEDRILMTDNTFSAFLTCTQCPCFCVCTSGDQLSAWSFGGLFDHNKWDIGTASVQDLDVYGNSFTFTSPNIINLFDASSPIPDANQVYAIEVRPGNLNPGVTGNSTTGYKSVLVQQLTGYYNSGISAWVAVGREWASYYVVEEYSDYTFTSSRGTSGCCKCGDYFEGTVTLLPSAWTQPGVFPNPDINFPIGSGYPSSITYSITCTL